tara:strand:- start:1215 stop:1487 length:273 start_codon:yes stop_codon:yes gene_type:complete
MNTKLDLLSMGHFLIYLCLGYFFKHKYMIALLLGILWELFEKILVSNLYTRYLLKEYWFIPIEYIDDTFEHSVTDIIINMIGYTIGSSIK